jgi:hypothetical protein
MPSCQLLVVVVEDMGSGEFVDNSRTMLSISPLSPLLASDFSREGGEGDACKARSRTCGRAGGRPRLKAQSLGLSTSSISDTHLLAYLSTAEQGNRF